MMKFSYAKLLVSIVLVLLYFLGVEVGFPDGGSIGHYVYPLCHVNVWHLSANVLCLWLVVCDLHLLSSYFVAVLCSFLPCFVNEPTMGFSGVLFAMVGMSWGRVRRFREMLWRNKWFLVVPLFVPHVNGVLHVYCLVAGWLLGRSARISAHLNGDWL